MGVSRLAGCTVVDPSSLLRATLGSTRSHLSAKSHRCFWRSLRSLDEVLQSYIGCLCEQVRTTTTGRLRQDVTAKIGLILDGFQPELRSFHNLLLETRSLRCADPRDKVYGILGMAPKSTDDIGIIPDYTQTISQVYQSVVLHQLISTKRLDVLSSCEMPRVPTNQQNEHGPLPTWVPDWSRLTKGRVLFPYRPDMGSRAVAISKGERILRVAGVSAARIQTLEYMPPEVNPKILSKWIKTIIGSDVLGASYRGEGEKLDAYCRTFCADHFADSFQPPSVQYPDWASGEDQLAHMLRNEEEKEEEEPAFLDPKPVATYLDTVFWYCDGIAFFRTSKGYMGLAPEAAKVGDVVCIFLGSSAPKTLREKGNNQYEVVGDAYLCGMLYGEAFLGRLPPEYRLVLVSSGGGVKSYHSYYLNTKRGILEVTDPRLRHLAPEVYLECERLGTGSAGVVTPDRLSKLGIKVVNFDLI